MKKNIFVVLALVICAILLTSNCRAAEEGVTEGKSLPSFTLEALDGGVVTVASSNKVTVINFWASWCPPCRSEMPEFYQYYLGNRDKVAFFAINLNESRQTVQNFIQNGNYSMPILLDLDGSVGSRFQVEYIPTTLVIDQNGIIRYRNSGKMSKSELERIVDGLPANGTAKPGAELVNNSDLDGSKSWIVYGKSEEVRFEDKSVRFVSKAGNNDSGIVQKIDTDVSGYSSLLLTIAFKVNHQTLSGTGWQAREAPLHFFVTYTDVNGVLHNALPVYKGYYPGEDQTNRKYWHGFYFLEPEGNSLAVYGDKVTQDEKYVYKIDLMKELNPKPKIIHSIGAGGSGWASREGTIYHLSLSAK